MRLEAVSMACARGPDGLVRAKDARGSKPASCCRSFPADSVQFRPMERSYGNRDATRDLLNLVEKGVSKSRAPVPPIVNRFVLEFGDSCVQQLNAEKRPATTAWLEACREPL